MKVALTVALLLVVAAGTAMASTIPLGPGLCLAVGGCPISIDGAGYTLTDGSVNIQYDNSGPGSASIDSTGIVGIGGPVFGSLVFTFYPLAPLLTGGLSFDFTLTGTGVNASDTLAIPGTSSGGPGLVDYFATGSGLAGSMIIPADPGNPYNQLTVYFPETAATFRISDFSYDLPSGVPEPGTYALLASGLLLVGFGKRKLLKNRS